MGKPLRVLIVEDSEDDAALLLRELKQGGYDPLYERVDTAAAMIAALERQPWQIVIADYSMPHFNGLDALKLLKERGLDLPFILVSGTIGEDKAVAAMKAGAHDYLMKDNLARLVPAVERELREAEARRRAQETEQTLSQRLLTIQEEERRQVAYDLHDGLAQMIVAAGMHLEIFRTERKRKEEPALEEEFTKATRFLNEAIGETRRIVSELRPALLDDFGLAEALRHYLAEMAERVGWQVVFEENLGATRLDKTVETTLFRIAQEALANAYKHAETTKVAVRLQRQGHQLLLEVQDWGMGFEAETAFVKILEGGHLGLAGMRERAQLVGGKLKIESAPGQGTLVRVSLTLKEEAKAFPTEVTEMAEEEQMMRLPSKDGVTVLIVDDHPMVREGLRAMLKVEGISVVGEAATGAEAVEQARRLQPDVVLMDVRMPDMDGLSATEILKAEMPSTSIIIVTSYESKDYLRRAILAGAAGYVLKGMSRDTLIDAIKVVKGGGSLIEGKLLSELLSELGIEGTRYQQAQSVVEALSPREKQVLQLLVQGLSNKEIASQMHYSLGTVKNVVQRVIEKLGVSDRTQAAVLAVRAGLQLGSTTPP